MKGKSIYSSTASVKIQKSGQLVVSTHSGPPYFLVGNLEWLEGGRMEQLGGFCCFETHKVVPFRVNEVIFLLPYDALKKGKEILKSQTHQKGKAKTWHRHLQEFLLKRFKNVSFLYCNYCAFCYLSFLS